MADLPNEANPTTGSVGYVDPDELHKNPAFTNVVVVEEPVRTVHVGGQNAVDDSGDIVGKGDVAPPRRSRCSVTCGRRWRPEARDPSTSSNGTSTWSRAWTCRTASPPSKARGTIRRNRRLSRWRSWRGSPTRTSWWRWTPWPWCLCEPRRGSRPRRACSEHRCGFSPMPRGRGTAPAAATRAVSSSGREASARPISAVRVTAMCSAGRG